MKTQMNEMKEFSQGEEIEALQTGWNLLFLKVCIHYLLKETFTKTHAVKLSACKLAHADLCNNPHSIQTMKRVP